MAFNEIPFYAGVRTSLLESEENDCPDCKEKGCSPASLIPNRFLRNSVNTFKTESGYSNAIQQPPKVIQKPPPPQKEEAKEDVSKDVANSEKEKTAPESETVTAPEQNPEVKNDVTDENENEEHHETKKDNLPAGEPISSHEESDFEDNIVVTIAKTSPNRNQYPPRSYNGNSFRKNQDGGYFVSFL